MIEINLLPLEMRKVDRTSMKRLLVMVSSVVLVSGSVIGLALSLKNYHSQSVENANATSEVARVEPVAKEYDVLAAQLKGIETRTKTIEDIQATRLRWGRKLDQLYVILPDYVWLNKLDLKKTRSAVAAKDASTATLLMECNSAGADEKKYAEFRRILAGEVTNAAPYTGTDFFKDFVALGCSGWERAEFAATEEGVALKFSLELPVKSLAPVTPPKPAVRPAVAAK